MRAVVKNRIGVFSPQGFLDGNNAPLFLTLEDIRATEMLSVDMLLVSLKKVVFFNRNGLDVFVNMMRDIRSKKQITIGFCDYDHKKYEAITKFYDKDLNFSLFRTQEIAELFVSTNQEKPKNVLIYNDDPSQRSTMAIELYDYGHNPIVAQSRAEFDEKKQHTEAYDAIVEDTYLGLFGQKIATRVKGNAIIYTIGNYLDAEIAESFNITYHQNSLNVGFRLFIFDAYKVISMNIHALNFFAKLASSAAEYNATICFVGLTFEKTPETFKNDLEDAGLLFFDTMDDILGDKELLHELGGSSAAMSQNKRQLTKVLVNELPKLIDATVGTMEMMTNAKAQKRSAEVRVLVLNQTEEMVASSIGFYGNLDGMIILVFPKKIAKKACELLIGEATDDLDDILDAIAEFVNIIGGRIKSLLAEQKISIDITLPRTYGDVNDLLDIVGDKKGVQVELAFQEDQFVFFLTR
jgi:CheY-specific phosphatase CheX